MHVGYSPAGLRGLVLWLSCICAPMIVSAITMCACDTPHDTDTV